LQAHLLAVDPQITRAIVEEACQICPYSKVISVNISRMALLHACFARKSASDEVYNHWAYCQLQWLVHMI